MYTLAQLKDQARHQVFTIKEKSQRLDSKDGEQAVPDLLLTEFINEAIVDVNVDLRVQAEMKVAACVVDSDEKLAPTDLMVVKNIEIFESAAPGAATPNGTSLTPVYSETALNALELNPVAGVPTHYLLWERQGERYFKWNRITGVAYQIHIYYYPVQSRLADDVDNSAIPRPYDTLIRYKVLEKIAFQLKDREVLNSSIAMYDREKMSKMTIASKPPARTTYRDMPGL